MNEKNKLLFSQYDIFDCFETKDDKFRFKGFIKRNLKERKIDDTYYYFWAFMALTVFFGQLYVGYGYRLMHGSILDLMDKVDGVLLHKSDRGPDFL
jgi:hypothetical protein